MIKSLRRRACLLWVPAALLLGSASVAEGAQTGRAAKERSAKKSCLAGDPAKGVEILAELYVETNDVTYLFNQGRCFEQNRRYEDAIARFREYLMKGETTLSDADRAAAKKHIEACELYMPKPEPHSPLVPEPVSATPTVQTPPPEVASDMPAGTVVVSPPPAAAAKAGSGLRIAGIAVGAVGVAAMGMGLAFNVKVNSMASDLEKPDNFNRDTDSSRKTYKTLGWVSYGVGAAGLAGGSLLYYLGWRARHDSASTRAALVPALAPGEAGALLTGAF
jgi:hypothetical protein